MKLFPESSLGKWTVILTLIALLLLAVFFLFMGIGLVDFDTGPWWNLTLLFAVPIELTAFTISIIATKRERNILINSALILGIISVLFLLTHSLYIHD